MADHEIKNMIPLYKVHLPADAQSSLQSVLETGNISGGANVHYFENLFRSYIGNPLITSTGDVSSSILLCLKMAGVRPGDEVIASPMACLATNQPIKNTFADVRWCDVDPLTGNMDPLDLTNKISSRTKAILLSHWAGNPADLDTIYEIAKGNNIPVVEDAGEALGAEYKGHKIGNTGADYTVFSFYPNRHINTIEGGAIAFASAENYERGQWLKRYGIHQPSFRLDNGEINPESDILEAGFNTYMNHISASIGVIQMKYLAGIVNKHQCNWEYYNEALNNMSNVITLRQVPDAKSACWVYTFLSQERDRLLGFLRDNGVYASKVHIRNDIYSCFGTGVEKLPGVEYFQSRCISIPSGWWVSDTERKFIIDCIVAFCQKHI